MRGLALPAVSARRRPSSSRRRRRYTVPPHGSCGASPPAPRLRACEDGDRRRTMCRDGTRANNRPGPGRCSQQLSNVGHPWRRAAMSQPAGLRSDLSGSRSEPRAPPRQEPARLRRDLMRLPAGPPRWRARPAEMRAMGPSEAMAPGPRAIRPRAIRPRAMGSETGAWAATWHLWTAARSAR